MVEKAGEMCLSCKGDLEAFPAFTEDPGSLPCTRIQPLASACNCGPRKPNVLFWPLGVFPIHCAHVDMEATTQAYKER